MKINLSSHRFDTVANRMWAGVDAQCPCSLQTSANSVSVKGPVTMCRTAVLRQQRCVRVCARRPRDPIVVPRIQMGDPKEEQSVDLMSYLVRQRIVYIGDRVVESTAMQTTVQLLALEAVDPETEIQIYINSTGGYPAAANAIVDTMKCLKCPVSTIALGACLASSMLVLAAGTRGRRFAMPNARLMLHQPTGGAEGTIFDVTPQAQELNRSMRVLQAMLADFSSMTLEQVEMETDRRTYFGPKEAVEKGLIDGIIE